MSRRFYYSLLCLECLVLVCESTSEDVPLFQVIHPTNLHLIRKDIAIPSGIKAFDVSNGTVLHFKCLGSRSLSWKFPVENMMGDISIASNIRVTQSCRSVVSSNFIRKVVRESRAISHQSQSNETDPQQVCETELIVNKTLAEHTGYYSCHYNETPWFYPPPPSSILYSNDSSSWSNNESKQAVYVFVNEPGFLFVPPDGNDFIFMSVVTSYPAIIPCKATASDVDVVLVNAESEVVKTGSDHGVYFDPTQGFYFESIQFNQSLSYLECRAKRDKEEEVIQVNLHFSIDPGNLHPIIDDTEASFVNLNSSFALTCSVRAEVGVIISGVTWNIPVTDPSRIQLEDSRSVRGGEGGQEQYIITSRRIVVHKSSYSDEGNYSCTVYAQTGKSYSVDHFVKIYDSSLPQFVNLSTDFYKDFDSPLKMKPGENVRFVVHVLAFPNISSCSFTWFKDSVKLLDVKATSASLYNHHSPSVRFSSSPLFSGKSSSPEYQDFAYNQDQETVSRVSSVIEEREVILRINSVTMKDSGSYTLVANTSDNSVSSSVSMILRVDGPPFLEIINDQQTRGYFLLDRQYTLSCTAFAPGVKEIYWRWLPCMSTDQCFLSLHPQSSSSKWIDILGTTVNDPKLLVPDVTVNSTQVILGNPFVKSVNLSVTAKMSGYYSCSAVNDMGSVREDSLFVVTEAENGFQVKLSTEEPVENDNMNITCIASRFRFSLNDTSSIHWTFVHVTSNDSSMVQINGSNDVWTLVNTVTEFDLRSDLVLSSANSALHSGTYTCSVVSTNTFSKTSSVRTNVFIERPDATIISNSNMNSTAMETLATSSLEFICEATGRPKPDVYWYKNGHLIDVNEAGIEVSSSKDRLFISRLAASDSGRYECVAENIISRDSRFQVLRVIEGGSMRNKRLRFWLIMLLVIIFVVFGGAFVIMAVFVGKKIRQDRRQKEEMKLISCNLFDQGQMGLFNPDLPLDEQAALLPYDHRWEFPRKRLKLGRILGQGAFGRVVIGEAIGLNDDEPSTTVAIKMLKERCDEQQRQALIAELKILIHLGRHVNIVNLLAAVTTGLSRGELLVVVEYCKFGNLREFLLKNRLKFVDQIDPKTGRVDSSIQRFTSNASKTDTFSGEHSSYFSHDYENLNLTANPVYINGVVINPEYDTLSVKYTQVADEEQETGDEIQSIKTCDLICYCFQVSRGMEYLASRKLIHRDLAARNVLLADEGVVKICDFGLAKDCYKYGEYVKTGNGALPIKWMAIESIRDKVFTTKSDVWSFGVLCWEIFSLGGNPYPGQEVNEEFYKKLQKGDRMEKPKYCPSYFSSDIMSRCWSEDPDSRPEFSELTDAIGSFLEDSVRIHYIDLNDPYQKMNQVLFANNEGYQSLTPLLVDEQITDSVYFLDDEANREEKLDDLLTHDNFMTTASQGSVCRSLTESRCSLSSDGHEIEKKQLRSASAACLSPNMILHLHHMNHVTNHFDLIRRMSHSASFSDNNLLNERLDSNQESYSKEVETRVSTDINYNSHQRSKAHSSNVNDFEPKVSEVPPPSSFSLLV